MTNFRHWARVLRGHADNLRARAERLSDEAKVTTGAYVVLMEQADLFDRAADAIEQALDLDSEVREALACVRELSRCAGQAQGQCQP